MNMFYNCIKENRTSYLKISESRPYINLIKCKEAGPLIAVLGSLSSV